MIADHRGTVFSRIDHEIVHILDRHKYLQPGSYYWIRKIGTDAEVEIGRVSTIFGKDREYWTVETIGSETHHMLYDFEFLAQIERPEFHRVGAVS